MSVLGVGSLEGAVEYTQTYAQKHHTYERYV